MPLSLMDNAQQTKDRVFPTHSKLELDNLQSVSDENKLFKSRYKIPYKEDATSPEKYMEVSPCLVKKFNQTRYIV